MSKKWKPNNLQKTQMLFQDEDELNAFHDVIYEVSNISYTDDELEKVFNMLPTSIQQIAFEWGMTDTEFREFAYKFFETTPINIRRSRETLIQR